jgi:hypothetical protein
VRTDETGAAGDNTMLGHGNTPICGVFSIDDSYRFWKTAK